ncbi:hypothetical protein MP228_000842 [Amoeboaphelidium protococcarum]|nr:hypothetical protein MP228_000842 [Amoeboaphelidium protococcarum]
MVSQVKPVPQLKDYGISEVTGFMPEKEPLRRLPGAFEAWEEIVDDIGPLLIALKLRHRVEVLPQLDVTPLMDDEQCLQRAFLVLCLICHAYVWGSKGQEVASVLPVNVARPWILISEKLGLRPISCHSALVYYNFKKLDHGKELTLDNLATLHTISGGFDESWFYLVTMAIEGAGAKALPHITSVLQQISSDQVDYAQVSRSLLVVASTIQEMSVLLMRMAEQCDPYIFYHRVRIYFNGWSNSKSLPNGVRYDGDTGEIEAMFKREGIEEVPFSPTSGKTYPGGSAAQSALIHALDIFLGVEHYPTKGSGNNSNFLLDMRLHMSAKYRAYLRALEQAPSLKQFVHNMSSAGSMAQNTDVQQCINAYNQCVLNMKTFRDKHIQIVTRYVIIQAQRAAQTGQIPSAASKEGYGGLGRDGQHVYKLDQITAGNGTIPPIDISAVNGAPMPPQSTSFKLSGKVSPSHVGMEELKTMNVQADGLEPPLQDGNSRPNGGDTVEVKITGEVVKEVGAGSRGTGGTEIIPFLKQARDETKAVLVPIAVSPFGVDEKQKNNN